MPSAIGSASRNRDRPRYSHGRTDGRTNEGTAIAKRSDRVLFQLDRFKVKVGDAR
jgi:hypothetical protein